MSDAEKTTVATSAFGALHWLYHQLLIPTTCPCGRINLIGGLILWRLDTLGQLGSPSLPRLALYGASSRNLRTAAEGVARLLDLPLREGRVAASRSHGQENREEILLVETPKMPPRNLEDDRHRYILFQGTNDPRLWHSQRAQARSVLPIRVSDREHPPYALPEINPVNLVCDQWLRQGKPRLHTGCWTWPCETTDWRSTVEDVLLACRWTWLPRTITTADDL